ncbi:MAG: NAD-dependent epimerase/dehydratase family protein [Burkholderiaceae bacterium]
MTMNVFCTGVSGYIGGAVAVGLIRQGHRVSGLVRSDKAAAQAGALGVTPVLGALDDLDRLRAAAAQADAVIHTANAEHWASTMAMLEVLENTGKAFVHTSGTSIVGRDTAGARGDAICDESSLPDPPPARASRAALKDRVLAYAARGIRTCVICPGLIYGEGAGAKKHSAQVPWLIDLAKRSGGARHYGPGENIWSHVHIGDLVDLFLLALASAPAGSFYFAENGENSMKEICEAINAKLGITQGTVAMSLEEAAREWGEGSARNTMGANSRVRALRARNELGWRPARPSLIEEIETGCYALELAA